MLLLLLLLMLLLFRSEIYEQTPSKILHAKYYYFKQPTEYFICLYVSFGSLFVVVIVLLGEVFFSLKHNK